MRLIDYFITLFAYVLSFKNTDQSKSFNELKNDIDELIRSSEKKFQSSDISSEDYDNARFAVFTWIDETILHSDWQDKLKWRGESLQDRYYNTTRGAVLFFQKLTGLKQNKNHVKEVFYTCLCFGFKGKYRSEEQNLLLKSLKTGLLQELTGGSMGPHSLDQDELIVDAYPRSTETSIHKRDNSFFSWSTLILIIIPIALYFLLFFVYQMVLNDMSTKIIEMV